jgi:hypothetical protein
LDHAHGRAPSVNRESLHQRPGRQDRRVADVAENRVRDAFAPREGRHGIDRIVSDEIHDDGAQ